MNNFKTRLNAIKKRKRFIFRGESRYLAGELEELLEGLNTEVSDARSVLEALAAFYKADKFIFERCDDSNGSVGDVYRYTAVNMFVDYAKTCDDKKWLAELIFKLYAEDDYGVRFCLLERMSEFLPEPCLRKTVDKFWALAEQEDDSRYGNIHVSIAIKSLAEQLKDPALLEQACKTFARKDGPSTASLLEMAALHLKCGNATEALEWINHVPPTERFMAEERDELLVNINKALGNDDAVRETAWRIFRSCRSPENFERIISLEGESKRAEIIDAEVALVLATEKLSYGDAAFLIETGRIDDAESYLIGHSAQFHGGYDYEHLLHFAKTFQKHNRFLVATLIYRALLESILARAKSKIYHHGINYLRKLDSLSEKISDWKNIENHAQYKARIKEVNKLKYTFWSEYDS